MPMERVLTTIITTAQTGPFHAYVLDCPSDLRALQNISEDSLHIGEIVSVAKTVFSAHGSI